MVGNLFSGIWNGNYFLYQNILGYVFGLVFLCLCLIFDIEIHRYCEKVAFITKSSRYKKFNLFFTTLLMFTCATLFYLSSTDWYIPILWLQNATTGEE